jgi:4-hydroxy-3-methylbut-2-enyl diphosphate reductase
VIGTFGQVPEGSMTLIETAADAERLDARRPANLAYLTQTTLSVDDTAEIVAILERRFPAIQGPRGEDICYATSNRQARSRRSPAQCDAMLVIGAPNSSNSLRLVEVAEREGVPARLIGRAPTSISPGSEGVRTLGITAGASAPETAGARGRRFPPPPFRGDRGGAGEGVVERMVFKLPRGLEAAA